MSNVYSILIADDEMIMIQGITKILNEIGARYELIGTAHNGQAALKLLEELQPDILIADIRMPVMDGLELIKRAGKLAHIPQVIITSGYDEFKYAQRAISLGVSEYLLKPITKAKLESTLNTLADNLDRQADKWDGKAFPTIGRWKKELASNDFVSEIEAYLRTSYSLQFTLEEIARRFHITPAYLTRIFKRAYGMPPLAFLTSVRIEKSKQLIASHPALGFRTIAELVGYPDANYFSKLFKKSTGLTLPEYKESIRDDYPQNIQTDMGKL